MYAAARAGHERALSQRVVVPPPLTCWTSWKLRAEGATAEETAGVMKSFWVVWPETFLPNICADSIPGTNSRSTVSTRPQSHWRLA